jgi:hypothetical protein
LLKGAGDGCCLPCLGCDRLLSVAPEALGQLGRGELIHGIAQVQQLIQPISDRAVRQAGGQAVPLA